MRNPNGFGSVVHLSGNRRKPYAVRKTTGYNAKGYPVYIVIGYYATREEGIIALAEYNKNPYDVDTRNITLKELYTKWTDQIAGKLSASLKQALKAAYTHIKKLDEMKYREIRSFHMQDTIDNCGHGYSTQGAIKNLWGYLDRYAMELEVIDKMYSQLTSAAAIEESSKTPFSEDEIKTLWEHKNDEWVDTILIMIYSGWRIAEFCELKTEDIDLNNLTMTGGIKTKNGKGRIVPIHSKILEFVKSRYNADSTYFLGTGTKHIEDFTYRNIFKRTMDKYGMKHNPHEARHTFRSRLDSAGANKKCIDLMMGHKSKDVGERVYTHKTIEELKQAIELLN